MKGKEIDYLNGSIILVTGGAGFIGHHLCRELLNHQPQQLIIVDDLSSGKKENLSTITDHDTVNFIRKDIRELTSSDLPGQIDYVFHLAALVSVPLSFKKPELTNQINEFGFLKVLESVKEKGVKKVAYASSSAVYGETDRLPIQEDFPLKPQSPYALSKLINEKYAQSYFEWYNIPSVGFRFFNVYGSGQDASSPYSGAISLFASKMNQKQEIHIFGDGKQVRDFVHVKDVVNALISGAVSGVGLGVYNVGSGVPTSINELFHTLKQVYNYKPEAKYLSARQGDIKKSLSSISKISNELGYQPTIDLFSGLNQLADELTQ